MRTVCLLTFRLKKRINLSVAYSSRCSVRLDSNCLLSLVLEIFRVKYRSSRVLSGILLASFRFDDMVEQYLGIVNAVMHIVDSYIFTVHVG